MLNEIEEVKKNRDKQLVVKDKQIENKDIQIAQMKNLLDQQQRLALQDKKLLEEYKEEIKELKSSVMPVREDEKDPVRLKAKDIDNIEEPQKKIKNGGLLEKM